MSGESTVIDVPAQVEPSTALAPVPKATPLPVFTGKQMAEALIAYRDLQGALDKSMPDQIMELDGKPFRKKGYWRAVAVAFGLSVEPITERRDVDGLFGDGRENFGWIVTYRATAPSGRSEPGDGSCFAIEKARRFRCPHPERPGSKRTLHFPPEACPDYDPEFQWKTRPAQATEHNVRSHAHTRAFNRAVSNLVGFGEVSAEEVEREERPARTHEEPPVSQPPLPQSAPAETVAHSGTYPAQTFTEGDLDQLELGAVYIVAVMPPRSRTGRELCRALLHNRHEYPVYRGTHKDLLIQAYQERLQVKLTLRTAASGGDYINGVELLPKAGSAF